MEMPQSLNRWRLKVRKYLLAEGSRQECEQQFVPGWQRLWHDSGFTFPGCAGRHTSAGPSCIALIWQVPFLVIPANLLSAVNPSARWWCVGLLCDWSAGSSESFRAVKQLILLSGQTESKWERLRPSPADCLSHPVTSQPIQMRPRGSRLHDWTNCVAQENWSKGGKQPSWSCSQTLTQLETAELPSTV